MSRQEKIRRAVTVGASYLGADMAQRESDESPCDVAELGLAIDLLEAVPDLFAALEELQRETIAAAKRVKSTWPLPGNHPAKALYDKVEVALARVRSS